MGVVYTEESIQARRQKLRSGTGSIRQWEWAHVLANARLGIPERSTKNYPGTTAGDTIYGMTLPELSTEWQVAWKTKKDIYGQKKPDRGGWEDSGR